MNERQPPSFLKGGISSFEKINEYMQFNHNRDMSVKSKAISFTYLKSDGKIEQRRVVPYTAKSGKYLYGFDLDKEALRTFVIDKMTKLVFLGED